MIKTRLSRTAAAAVVSLAAFWAPAKAEVSAEIDASGRYVRMVLISNSSARNVRIWTVAKAKTNLRPVNREGDLNGDLWPVIGDPGGLERAPWVVWSRASGEGFDIAYARWDSSAGGWTPIGWLAPDSRPGDDLGPAIAFDVEKRPHLAWWRNEQGVGRVYLSLWLVTRWMNEYLVSDPDVDSVNPSIAVLSDGRIQVAYDTPSGRVTRIVGFSRPSTITDDITPFGRFRIEETLLAPVSPH